MTRRATGVEQSSKQIGIEHFGAHDLRRTCAKLCWKNGGDLERIKFLLGHSSIQTTERYLGSDEASYGFPSRSDMRQDLSPELEGH